MNEYTIADIKVGDTASFERTIVQSDVDAFIALSGDTNPLHHNPDFAAQTQFKKPIVHGMLLGALCSRLIGVHLPGKNALFLSHSLTFKKPVYVGETIKISGVVTSKSEATRIIEVSITISSEEEVAVEGQAVVQLLN
jgi:3-hydroxybutyryl-CoA dehydratase